MINASYRKCTCPACDCGEDCNGFWGTPNEDKAYECCWSVGDKVKMTHVIKTNYEYKAGGIVSGINFCIEETNACGRVIEISSSEKIEVEYVCIGARGNAHTNPSPFADLPDYINGVAWKDEGKGADPELKDGWQIPPVVYIPVPESPTSQTPDNFLLTAEVGDIWPYGLYTGNIQHISGCVNNWPYRYERLYNGFVVAQDPETELKYFEPIPIDTDQTPKIETYSDFCGCIDCLLEQKNVSICGAQQYLDCNDIDENGVPVDCKLRSEFIITNACDCGGNSSDVPGYACKNFDCEYCLHPDSCERINKCNPNSDCSCFVSIDLKESDLEETDHGFEVDTEGYILDTEGNRIPSGRYRGRYENKIFQTATIFALDLTNPDIQYCSQVGYFIEKQVSHNNGTKWQKYELSPYLLLFNRPILEWDCDCKDENGDYILPDGVGEGFRREVYGGFSWYFWNGNCEGECNDLSCSLKSPAPCVAGCDFSVNEYEGSGDIPPCREYRDLDNNQTFGPAWAPFSQSTPIFGGQASADFLRCINCVEGISSCSGFKSYCIKRKNVIPDEPGSCPGECQGFYGVMQNAGNACNQSSPDPPDPEYFCGYGCADPANTLCSDDSIQYPCSIGSGTNFLYVFPSPYPRYICETYAIHTLTIEPIQDQQKRCMWYDFTINNKNYRCCGQTRENAIGKDVGSPIDIDIELDSDNNLNIKYNDEIPDLKIPNNLEFSWTEGIGWISSCPEVGIIYDGDSTTEIPNAPEVICNEGNGCGSVQCSGTTGLLSGSQISSGNYPCYLATTQRTCCQLPYDIACVQDSWWPHGEPNNYGSEQFWFIQELVSNGNITTGCSCTRPSCSCFGSSVEELPEGRYSTSGLTIQTDNNGYIYAPECDTNNYSILSFYYPCTGTPCKQYVANSYYCDYNPENPVGTISSICKG